MSSFIRPDAILRRLADDLPQELHGSLLLAGSLAAAYHYADEVDRGGVRTKDADLCIRPAGNTLSAQGIAAHLLSLGWRRTEKCYPSTNPEDDLRAIRLYPPAHKDYFIELLILPDAGQSEAQKWHRMELNDGWYGLPSFEFMALLEQHRQRSTAGIEYAAPSMMALANLLSHREVGTQRMSGLIGGREILRSAKDLGRVLALAHLATRPKTRQWSAQWIDALETCFRSRSDELRARVGMGLRALLADRGAFGEALHTCDFGLLNGLQVTSDSLRGTADRLILDVIEPVEAVEVAR